MRELPPVRLPDKKWLEYVTLQGQSIYCRMVVPERALRGGDFMPQHSIYWRKYTCGVCGLTIWVPAYMTGVACPSHECQLNRTEERVNTPADLPVGEYWLPWSLQART